MKQPMPRPRPQWGSSDITDAMKCMSHPRRAMVLIHLLKAGPDLGFGELASALKLPAATLSHYVDLYEKAGLMKRTPHDDRTVTVGLRLDKVEALAGFFAGMWKRARELQGVK